MWQYKEALCRRLCVVVEKLAGRVGVWLLNLLRVLLRFLVFVAVVLLSLFLVTRGILRGLANGGDEELECRWSGRDLADRLADSVESEGVILPVLKPAIGQGRSALALAEAAWLVAFNILAQRSPESVKKRERALFMGKVVPLFALVVALMAVVAMKQPLHALAGFLLLCLMVQIPVLTTLSVDLEAAKLARKLIESRRVFSRLGDEEKVLAALRYVGWRRILPFGW